VNYRKLFQETEHPRVLYLALLLHDVGKAANLDRHAEASVEAARKVAARLHLDQDRTERLLFLVRDHLKLSMLSQRRDIDDQATIEAAARIVKTDTNLDLLQLLTFADAAGTSLKGWSDWKEALLWELYHRTRQALTGPERARNILAKRIEQLYGEVSGRLEKKLPLEEIYSHFELMSASYYINTSADLIADHLDLIHRFMLRQQDVEKPEQSLAPVIDWRPHESRGYSQVDICTWDRLGLFSKICASFAAAELNILRARVYTRGDHVVLDVFEVCDRDHHAVHDKQAVKPAESMLTRILTLQEDVDFQEIIDRLRSLRRPTPRLQEMTIPTVITFDNEISDQRTVIEVQTEDRVGLLYTLTNAMSELGLDISIAKIATEKGAAFDSFYVMDHQVGKVTDQRRLDQVRRRLEEAIGSLAATG
jgi:[protein-PII] uridylyltransferase